MAAMARRRGVLQHSSGGRRGLLPLTLPLAAIAIAHHQLQLLAASASAVPNGASTPVADPLDVSLDTLPVGFYGSYWGVRPADLQSKMSKMTLLVLMQARSRPSPAAAGLQQRPKGGETPTEFYDYKACSTWAALLCGR